ncbi:hypothetical protein [Lysinibacillus telephonicus]|uniref:hypothetical protein n=1 Tax=Lysinibacillus telephonicus TaxID=1714840 RepID=UPI0016399016|nr:hypothetical protein [Lysinibacillus telephonicus]
MTTSDLLKSISVEDFKEWLNGVLFGHQLFGISYYNLEVANLLLKRCLHLFK